MAKAMSSRGKKPRAPCWALCQVPQIRPRKPKTMRVMARYPYALPQDPGKNSGKCSRAKSPKRPRMMAKKAYR